jgi:hypothetical protein
VRARVHSELIAQGKNGGLVETQIFNIVANPVAFFADEMRARPPAKPRYSVRPPRREA